MISIGRQYGVARHWPRSITQSPARKSVLSIRSRGTASCHHPVEPKQQSVIALARRVDHLLVDQDGVNHTAHLDQLLPVAAVAREAGDFAGRYCADLAEADLGHHPFEPDARHATRG